MKRTISLVFAALFLALCAVPAVGLLYAGGAEPAANEVPVPAPSLQTRAGGVNTDVLPDLAKYIDARFYLRQECVTGWAKLNAGVFRTSAADDVLLGRDGWLYYAPTLNDYTRSDPMDGRELWCAARTLYLIDEYVRSRGGRFLFAVAPNKNSLYAENMPAVTRADAVSNSEALQVLLAETGVPYADLFAAFRDRPETLYFKTDSHWTGAGAALAADTLLAALGREGAAFSGPFIGTEHRGDLYEMLYPAGRETEPDVTPAAGFSFTANTANADSITITTENAGGSGSLLMYRDSFGRNLYPYLAEAFAEARFSRKNDYDPTAMEDGGTVIVELVERNLRYLNEYPPTLPAPERRAAELASAEAGDALSARKGKGGPEGYALLSAAWADAVPNDDAPVYITAGETAYEAVPLPGGFSACLPEEALTGELHVIFRCGMNLIALPLVIE